MTSATGNGCENGTRLVTNTIDATTKSSCFVQCMSGYRTTLSDEFGGRVFCPSNAQEGAPVQYTFQCSENSCAPLQLDSVGLTGSRTSSPCLNQLRLSTHSNPTCSVRCKSGYESTTSEATYTCATNSEDGASAQISPSITCIENTCKVKLSRGMTASDVQSASCVSCVSGLSLFTHSSPNCCDVQCDAGYVSGSTQQINETLDCPRNASNEFQLIPSTLSCNVAITRIEMRCKSNGCESVGNNNIALPTMRDCNLVQSTIDTDSNVFVATEGGDEIVFSNFDTSSQTLSTHWKMFVDDSMSGDDCVTFSNNNSMTCKIPASSGKGRRLSLMKYDASSEEYSDTQILSGCLVDYAEPVVNEIVGCPTEGCNRDGGDTITIRGSNFGSDGALIFVNGVECINVTHDCASPDHPSCHRNLRCTTRGLDTWQSQVNTMLVVRGLSFFFLLLLSLS